MVYVVLQTKSTGSSHKKNLNGTSYLFIYVVKDMQCASQVFMNIIKKVSQMHTIFEYCKTSIT